MLVTVRDGEQPLGVGSLSSAAPEAARVVVDAAGPPVLTGRLAQALLRAVLNVERLRAAENGGSELDPPALAS